MFDKQRECLARATETTDKQNKTELGQLQERATETAEKWEATCRLAQQREHDRA